MLRVVGVMSGTSVDGIDIVVSDIHGSPPRLHAEIVQAQTVDYAHELRERILAVCIPGLADEVCRLNFEISEQIAHAILDTIDDLSSVDLIASHGQTIWHDVNEHGHVTSTLQIGSAAVIAERTGITTINNFRERDVAAGGHGAPLTAYIDWLLLRHDTKWRAIQNIGGIANVSFLPPLGAEAPDLIAFDTGPGNALIDGAMRILTQQQQHFDQDGAMAASGAIEEAWLQELLDHAYFQQIPPRTTGRELFGDEMARRIVTMGHARGCADVDIIATITALTAVSIADAYRRFAPASVQEVILGGGGVHNQTLRRMLDRYLAPAIVRTHEDIGLSSDYKEALAFAVLGYETWHQRNGTLPSQTGAIHGTILGQVTPGQNFQNLIRKTWL